MVLPKDSGIYTVPFAAKLLTEDQQTIRRWAFGYSRRGKQYKPAIETHLPEIQGERAVTFLELVELMFIRGFLKSGASWSLVREAAQLAAKLTKSSHPFAMRKWFADPGGIYTLLEEVGGGETFVELRGHGQIAMRETLAMYLDQLEFVDQVAVRWFPRGRATPVVVDPTRVFGAPIVHGTAIATGVLAEMHRAGESPSSIAWWYDLHEYQVEAAIQFENELAAS